jgi:exodeoxyribonuclease-5
VSLRFLDYNYDLDARILLDSLHTETPAAQEQLNKQLFTEVSEDYGDIGNKRERMKQMTENEFFNSLQVKFAYAVTCHKAQGGQWDTVYIDQGYVGEEVNEDYYHWLYTALTRATNKLFLVNFPKEYFL